MSAGIYYSKEHEWIRMEDEAGKKVTLGISKHAAEELGDITFVELPAIDAEFKSGNAIAVVESVKAASDIFTPVGGVVVDVNDKLEEEPELVNASAEENGWICTLKGIEMDTLGTLMNEEEYAEYIK